MTPPEPGPGTEESLSKVPACRDASAGAVAGAVAGGMRRPAVIASWSIHLFCLTAASDRWARAAIYPWNLRSQPNWVGRPRQPIVLPTERSYPHAPGRLCRDASKPIPRVALTQPASVHTRPATRGRLDQKQQPGCKRAQDRDRHLVGAKEAGYQSGIAQLRLASWRGDLLLDWSPFRLQNGGKCSSLLPRHVWAAPVVALRDVCGEPEATASLV